MAFLLFIALGDLARILMSMNYWTITARGGKTSAILLYLEQLSDARRFVSAARSAS